MAKRESSMENMVKGKKTNAVILSLLVNLLIGLIAFCPIIISNGGMFSLGTDYDTYQIPTYNFLRNSIVKGEIFWNWNLDLGTDFITGSSFLILGSPFFWMTVPFYRINYLYLGGWMFILKYAIAGMTSALFLKRYFTNKKYILLGSILYAFSGFQSVNLMMGSFHDVVALFPLMLFGLDKLVIDKRKGAFAISVFICAITNYYFFVGEVIFVVIYYFVRFGWTEKRISVKQIAICILEGVIGIGMSAVIFLPSVMSILGNPRGGNHLLMSEWLSFNTRDVLKIWRSFFFPGEMMQQWSCAVPYDWSSSSCYLPLVGLTLVISFLISKKTNRTWLKKTLIVFGVMMAFPVTNSVYTLFTDAYCRWYFMPILLMSLASAKVVEEWADYPIFKCTIVVIVLEVVSILAFVLWNSYRYQIIYDIRWFSILSGIGIIGNLIILYLNSKSKNKDAFGTLLMFVVLFAVLTTIFTTYRYQEVRGYSSDEFRTKIELLEELRVSIDLSNEPYRVDTVDNLNAFTLEIMPLGSFCNSVEGSVFKIWFLIGENRRVYCPDIPEGFSYLVGSRYHFEKNETGYFLVENEKYRSIGNVYKFYICENDLKGLSKEEIVHIMQNAIVCSEEQVREVGRFLSPYNGEEYMADGIFDFRKTSKNCEFSLNSDEEGILLMTIPFSRGWKAIVNGVERNIEEFGGFMGVSIDSGTNNVQFTYCNQYVMIGAIISLISFIFVIAINILDRKSKNGKCTTCN